MTFTDAVVALKQRGISQRQIAELLGVTEGMISLYKKGFSQPSIESAHLIVTLVRDQLGVVTTIDELFPPKEAQRNVQAG